jgi:hypothetical protein
MWRFSFALWAILFSLHYHHCLDLYCQLAKDLQHPDRHPQMAIAGCLQGHFQALQVHTSRPSAAFTSSAEEQVFIHCFCFLLLLLLVVVVLLPLVIVW